MIETLLGSENAEKVLVFILIRGKGYPSEIASFYQVDLYGVQNQLAKFENGGVLVSFLEGKTRIFEFNPLYIFLPELKQLLPEGSFFLSVRGDRKT